MSVAEEVFLETWQREGFAGSDLVREHRFHPVRKWRLDFAFPSAKLGIEIDGRGRHQTVNGVRRDCEKHNTALLLGWRILRFPATDKQQAEQWVELTCELLTMLLGESHG